MLSWDGVYRVVVSYGASSSSAVGGSSEMALTAAVWMHKGEVGYPAVRMESGWLVRMSMMFVVLS